MLICNLGIYLGYLMTIYFIASLYYLITTKNIETPFYDSLTPEQKAIKRQSATLRRTIFIKGILLGVFSCIWFQPFINVVLKIFI